MKKWEAFSNESSTTLLTESSAKTFSEICKDISEDIFYIACSLESLPAQNEKFNWTLGSIKQLEHDNTQHFIKNGTFLLFKTIPDCLNWVVKKYAVHSDYLVILAVELTSEQSNFLMTKGNTKEGLPLYISNLNIDWNNSPILAYTYLQNYLTTPYKEWANKLEASPPTINPESIDNAPQALLESAVPAQISQNQANKTAVPQYRA